MANPVTLDDALRQLQLDESADAGSIQEAAGFLEDAAAWVEEYTGHLLYAREITQELRGFENATLSGWPIKPNAVPVVTYSTQDGATVAVTGVRIDTSRRPARIVPWIGTRWPRIAKDTAVSVTFRAGYEGDELVPGNMRRAILLLISAYDADREGGDVFAKAEASARRLCRWFRIRRL